jgi:hypothetical protein
MTAAAASGRLGWHRNLPGNSLTAADLEQLSHAGIDRWLAESAGLRRVDSAVGAELIGRNTFRGDFSGIAIPYLWPAEEAIREYRLRRDHPDLEAAENGRFREKNKYLSPPGRGNLIYIPPEVEPSWLADESLPIILAEGEKKALSLWGLAWNGLGDAAESPRFLPVAVPGVWNWYGKVGRTEAPGGGFQDVKGPVPDLERIPVGGRQITILYDANVATNESVRIAREALAALLRRRKACVLYLDIPPEENVNGIDDLIGLWGPERVLDWMRQSAYDPKSKKAAGRSSIRIQDIPSVRTFARRQIEFIVPKLIARGTVTVISADPGAGKTTLSTWFGERIAYGRQIFGHSCLQCDVLILDRENDVAVKNELLDRLQIDDGGPLKIWGSWLGEEAPAPGSPLVLDWVTATEPRPLIIVDSLIAFLDGDENDSHTMRQFFTQLRRLADLGAAVLVLHHTGKSETSRNYRGSSDIPAVVDVGYLLTNFGDTELGRMRLKTFKARFTVERDLIIHYQDGTFAADQRSEAATLTVREQLAELLHLHPGCSGSEFQMASHAKGLPHHRARDFLRAGESAGTIVAEKGSHNAKFYWLKEQRKDCL